MSFPKLVWLLAAACGIGIANIYYNQPLLQQMALPFGPGTAYLPMFTQLGTGCGMFLFVPLGDMRERRGLICGVLLLAMTACILAALATTLPLLAAASALVGFTAVTPHLILPLAAQLAPPEQRGRVLGTVLSGLLLGILLARTLSGFVGAWLSWRAVYWFAAAFMLLLAAVLRIALPVSRPEQPLRYGTLFRSLLHLVVHQPLLREAALVGGLLFGSFSAFWATLAFVLAAPPYRFGARMAGAFGLIGVAGALAASVAGRVADRRGARFTVLAGIVMTAFSWVVFLIAGQWFWGLVAGVTLLDLGVQTGHVANQTRIYSIDPAARSRLNTVYMVTYFAGGALGSALSAAAWTAFGWPGVCSVGFLLSAAAGAAMARRNLRPPTGGSAP